MSYMPRHGYRMRSYHCYWNGTDSEFVFDYFTWTDHATHTLVRAPVFSNMVLTFTDALACTVKRTRATTDPLNFTDNTVAHVTRRLPTTDDVVFSDFAGAKSTKSRPVADNVTFGEAWVCKPIRKRVTNPDVLILSDKLKCVCRRVFHSNSTIVFPPNAKNVTIDIYGLLGTHTSTAFNPQLGPTYNVLVTTLLIGLLVIGGSLLASRVEVSYTI